MKLRLLAPLFTIIGVVLSLLIGLENLRHGGGALAGGALVAGAVLVAGARIRGGLLGEFGGLYWLVVLAVSVWSMTEFKHGGAAAVGGGLIATALLVAFQRPKDKSEPNDED